MHSITCFLHPHTTVVHPRFEALASFVESLPDRFARNEGELIRRERNELRVLEHEGKRYVVKSYRRPILINRFVYGILRPSKAKRAYRYALRLLELGVGTPQPVGYLNMRRWGLFDRSYYISCLSDCPYLFKDLFDGRDGDTEAVCRAVGETAALLHRHGIRHNDYGKENILYRRAADGTVKLDLIDLNRMRFGRVGVKAGCKEFGKLMATPQMQRWIAEAYAKARGFDVEACFKLITSCRDKRKAKKGERY
ncbi:MAG: hypothetical protein LUB83_02345 [Prevotellaceae bacterium]|nr:hypothetical protein [Prevotellaceae bacterium]